MIEEYDEIHEHARQTLTAEDGSLIGTVKKHFKMDKEI